MDTNQRDEEANGALAGLVTLAEYQADNPRFFPGLEAVRWYLRQHRQPLLDAGALLYIRGQLWVDAARFGAYVRAAGQQAAKRRAVAA